MVDEGRFSFRCCCYTYILPLYFKLGEKYMSRIMNVLLTYKQLDKKGKLGKLGKERYKELLKKNIHKKVVQKGEFNVS
jgi:hypothetical protein